MRLIVARLAFLIISTSCIQSLLAQTYPSKPLHIIVPSVPGGAIDQIARAVSAQVAESIGQSILVENRPGGSFVIGMHACAKAPPDGYTLCIADNGPLSYNPYTFKELPYDADKDFVPVINLASGNAMLVAKGSAPFNSFKEMVALAKLKPGVLNWGTWGPGSMADIYLKWVEHQTGVGITPVPYKGSGQAIPALLAGDIDITFASVSVVLPHLKSGRLKPIAVVTSRRSVLLPDVPTLAEEGADPGIRTYFGVFAPAGTPAPIIERLNAEFASALQHASVRDYFSKALFSVAGGSAAEFAKLVKEDRANFGRIFKTLGMRPG